MTFEVLPAADAVRASVAGPWGGRVDPSGGKRAHTSIVFVVRASVALMSSQQVAAQIRAPGGVTIYDSPDAQATSGMPR